MPAEKPARQEASLSSEDEKTPQCEHVADAILESIAEKLKKIDVLTIENTVGGKRAKLYDRRPTKGKDGCRL